jgi:hypothetical protein
VLATHPSRILSAPRSTGESTSQTPAPVPDVSGWSDREWVRKQKLANKKRGNLKGGSRTKKSLIVKLCLPVGAWESVEVTSDLKDSVVLPIAAYGHNQTAEEDADMSDMEMDNVKGANSDGEYYARHSTKDPPTRTLDLRRRRNTLGEPCLVEARPSISPQPNSQQDTGSQTQREKDKSEKEATTNDSLQWCIPDGWSFAVVLGPPPKWVKNLKKPRRGRPKKKADEEDVIKSKDISDGDDDEILSPDGPFGGDFSPPHSPCYSESDEPGAIGAESEDNFDEETEYNRRWSRKVKL